MERICYTAIRHEEGDEEVQVNSSLDFKTYAVHHFRFRASRYLDTGRTPCQEEFKKVVQLFWPSGSIIINNFYKTRSSGIIFNAKRVKLNNLS